MANVHWGAVAVATVIVGGVDAVDVLLLRQQIEAY